MGMAAILVTWPGPFEQTLVPASWGVSIWNLSLIGPVVSEEKMFEIVDGWTTDGGRSAGILLAHPWAFGSGELKKNSGEQEKKSIIHVRVASWFHTTILGTDFSILPTHSW